ncbi:MAG: hypothetical protein WAR41_02640 [Azonexus sp.]
MLAKTRFWQRWATTPLNERQVMLLNRLQDGFDGKLNSKQVGDNCQVFARYCAS